jgi:hypothetical protein
MLSVYFFYPIPFSQLNRQKVIQLLPVSKKYKKVLVTNVKNKLSITITILLFVAKNHDKSICVMRKI